MGWLFTPGQTRKQLIQQRTQGWSRTREEQDDLVAKYPELIMPWAPVIGRIEVVCLRHCWKGNITHSGRLWSVWEHRAYDLNGNRIPEATYRYIAIDLCEYHREDAGWGYKDLDESMGPCELDCPLSYLDEAPLSPHSGRHSAEWRKSVRNYHEHRKEQKARTRKAATR